jgi:hypothetical protein
MLDAAGPAGRLGRHGQQQGGAGGEDAAGEVNESGTGSWSSGVSKLRFVSHNVETKINKVNKNKGKERNMW